MLRPGASLALTPGVVWLCFVRPCASPDRLEALLDADERARAVRFRSNADRTGFITMHAATRILLAAILGEMPAALAFGREAGGKPVLPSAPNLHFNLSRTRGLALIGIAAAPIGVDVEAIRPMSDASNLAARFFAPSESAGLAAAGRDDAFFACWSRKEAVVKALGLGLAKPLDAFEVDPDPARPALLSMDGERAVAGSWSMWGRQLGPVWAAAAAAFPGANFRSTRLDLSLWH